MWRWLLVLEWFRGVARGLGKMTELLEALSDAWSGFWLGRTLTVKAEVGAAFQAEARARAAKWLAGERVGRNRSEFH